MLAHVRRETRQEKGRGRKERERATEREKERGEGREEKTPLCVRDSDQATPCVATGPHVFDRSNSVDVVGDMCWKRPGQGSTALVIPTSLFEQPAEKKEGLQAEAGEHVGKRDSDQATPQVEQRRCGR